MQKIKSFLWDSINPITLSMLAGMLLTDLFKGVPLWTETPLKALGFLSALIMLNIILRLYEKFYNG